MALPTTILCSILLGFGLTTTQLILFYDTNIHITHSVSIAGIYNALELADREINNMSNSTQVNGSLAQLRKLLKDSHRDRLDTVTNNFRKLDLGQHGTRYKRATILNLGIISPYLGIASTAATDHNSQAIKELRLDVNAESSKVKRNMETIARNMAAIEDFASKMTKHVNTGRFIFLHTRKIDQLISSLEHSYLEIIDILEAGDQNKASRHMFDINNLAHTLDKFDTPSHFPLYTKVNTTYIFKAAITTTTTTSHEISQTIKVPLIVYNDICSLQDNNVTCTHNLTVKHDLKTCHRISNKNKDLLCHARPCFYDPSIYHACTAITHTSYKIDPKDESTCITNSRAIESLERLNASALLTIPLSHHIFCIGLEIHNSRKTIIINHTSDLTLTTSFPNQFDQNSLSLRLEKLDRLNTTKQGQPLTHTVSHTTPYNYTWIPIFHSPILVTTLILIIVLLVLTIRYFK